MAERVIEIFGDGGEVKKYRPLSVRLPEFLQVYGPDKGYRVVMKETDMASLQGGLVGLYAEALKTGQNPKELGLPPLASGIVFRASLLDKGGNEIANATAHRFRLENYKDFEKGETAARQRLLAVLGFGGDVLDEDETGDIADQGRMVVSDEGGDKGKGPGRTKQHRPEPKSETPPPEPPPENDEQPSGQENTSEQPASPVPAAVLRQIEHQAKLKGKPIPKVNNLEEARAELKRLMAA